MKTKFNLLAIAVVVATGCFTSCKNKDKDEAKPDALPRTVTGTFTGDSIWRNGPGAVDYCLEGIVTVRRRLTIEPGTVICAKPGAGLIFDGAQSAMVAKGTAALPIVLRSETDTKGGWRGVRFSDSNNPLNELTYVTVKDGGSASFDGDATRRANVQFGATNQIRMVNCTVNNGQAHGLLELFTSVLTINDFANNAFADNSEYPLFVFDQVARNLGNSSTFARNSRDFIALKQKDFKGLPGAHTWQKQAVPYFWDDTDNLVVGYLSTNGSLTLEAGATLVMGPGSGIVVGDNTNATSSLTLAGTAADKVTIRGSTDQPGAWKGILISTPSVNNTFTNALITNGGASGFTTKANILVGNNQFDNSRLTLTNVEISRSAGCGLSRGNSSNNEFVTSGVTYSGNAGANTCTH